MRIDKLWCDTFKELVEFTTDLEREESTEALSAVTPLWRIMKAVQLRYVPTLDEEVERLLEDTLGRLGVYMVAPTPYGVNEVAVILTNVGVNVAIDHGTVERLMSENNSPVEDE